MKSPPGAPSIKYSLSHTGSALTVTILECKVKISCLTDQYSPFSSQNLNKTDLLAGAPDGVVEVYLLPGDNKPEKTKVVKSTIDPVFNESFHFQVYQPNSNLITHNSMLRCPPAPAPPRPW